MNEVLFKRAGKKLRGALSQEGMTGFDMHFHTRYSMDGLSRIPNAMKRANKKGIGVAITDHNEIKGATACQRNRYKVPIIPGIEVTCKEGTHMLVYFYSHDELREFYTKYLLPGKRKDPFRAPITVKELLEISKDYNCINSAAHPFSPGVLGLHQLNPDKRMIRNLDNIEVLNGYNTRLMNVRARTWAEELNKNPTGGSDGHSTSELGKVLTFVNGTTVEELLDAVKKGKARIIGKETKLLKRLVLAVDKEGLFIKRSKQQQKAKVLLKSQFGGEYKHIREAIKNRKSRKMKHFRERHIKPPKRKGVQKMFKSRRTE